MEDKRKEVMRGGNERLNERFGRSGLPCLWIAMTSVWEQV